MKVRLRKKQQGVAAIWLALTLVPVMGFTFLSVEGTRYIQTSARLHDSLEAAAIAVTVADFREAKTGSGQLRTDELATRYVNAYVRGVTEGDIVIQSVWEHQEWVDENTPEHIQYRVTGTTNHDSWFASQFIPSFDETQAITGQSLAKKYPVFLGDNNIDLMLVSDFSGSMNWRWGSKKNCTETSCKIRDLKNAIRSLAETVLCNKVVESDDNSVCLLDEDDNEWNNRIGIVPFNIRTRELHSIDGSTQAIATSQLVYRDEFEPDVSDDDYYDIDWDDWRVYSRNYIRNCVNNSSNCYSEHRIEVGWHWEKQKNKKVKSV
ncbi:protein tadG [Vibrio sp. JCM 19236]|nr:protein tadG [Vibrio sp. JCM 19236]